MSKQEPRINKLERHLTRQSGTETRVPSDPVAFACSLGIEPDPWQRDLLTATDDRIILNCSRQSGKSTIVAILALYRALTTPRSLVLILSPTQRQSAELFRKVTTFYRICGDHDYNAPSATALELENGSRIVALPGSEGTIRGYSNPCLVLIDEAAQVSDDLYYTVTPMFAVSQGQLILLSTPRGKDGIFWRAWNDEESGWKKIKVTADECPRISQEYLDRERRAMGSTWYAQEYCCEFVQPEGSPFNEAWIQYYEPGHEPVMDVVILSWDTALTKSESSDLVVGQAWGRAGADYYLLDQVSGKFDFDETIVALKAMSARLPQATAKIIEGQALGAAIASHLKHEVDGIIPIHVRASKEARALNCLPVWQSGNVYIPRPDNGSFVWVRDYLRQLITFPNAAHDDMVDATTLALNQLKDPLFQEIRRCVIDSNVGAKHVGPSPNADYRIGWVPARHNDYSVILVLNEDTNEVVSFERVTANPFKDQIEHVLATSRKYNDAPIRARVGFDDALLRSLAYNGGPLQKVALTDEEWVAAFDNLSMMMQNGRISYLNYPDLIAELEVFKSDVTFTGAPDYTLQRGQDTAIRALCLVTYDLSTEDDWWRDVYYFYK